LIAGEAVPAIERAIISLDGTVGPFGLPSGLSLTETRARHTSVVVGNQAYLVGGVTLSSSGQTDVVPRSSTPTSDSSTAVDRR